MADNLDDLADAVHARPTLTGIDYSVAHLGVEALESYPRVVWVSEGGSIDAVDDVGSRTVGADNRRRQVRTDAMDVQLHIWGEDREAARLLMHALVYTIWEQCYGACELGKYQWVTEQEDRGEFAIHGSKILLELTIRLPVNEGASALTIIETATHTGTFVSDLDGSEEDICT
jgi:hypothetical protein